MCNRQNKPQKKPKALMSVMSLPPALCNLSSRVLKLKRWTLPDVPNNDDHKLFKDYMEIYDKQRETTRTRRDRVIKQPMYQDDYRI